MYTLLIVDDEPSSRAGLQDYIDWASCGIGTTIVAEDGESALEQYDIRKPDLILTDVMMPGIDGIELARRIRERNPAIPILFLSGHGDVEYLHSALKIDAFDYFVKPVNLSELTEVIGKAVKRLNDERERLERMAGMNAKLSESLPLLRERFLTALIRDGAEPNEPFRQRAEFLGISLPPDGSYCVFVISVDHSEQLFASWTERDRQLLSFSLLNISQEMIDRRGIGFAFEHRSGEYVCLVGLDTERGGDDLSALVEALRDTLSELLKISVTIGIGRPVDGLRELPLSYALAREAAEQKMFVGSSSIIMMDSLRGTGESLFRWLPKDAAAFSAAIRSGSADTVLRMLDETVAAFASQPGANPRMFRNFCLQLLLIGSNLRMELDLAPDSAMDENRLWERLLKLELAEEIRALLSVYMTQLCREIALRRQSGTRHVVARAIEIMEARMADNLTISQIADEVYLSSTYFCLLFKQETGRTVNEYLTHIRMERAKELLRDLRHRTGDVSRAVGYTDASYFTKQFKKHTGLTPKEYREH